MYAEITRQLVRTSSGSWIVSWRSHGAPRRTARFEIPVPQEDYMRCWGSTTPPGGKGLEFERSDCAMDSRVFVSHVLITGHLSVRHEAYDGRRLGALRFAQRYSASFQNEPFGGQDHAAHGAGLP